MNLSYPILEHEYDSESKLEPSRMFEARDMPQVCVICFFKEVIDKVVADPTPQTAMHIEPDAAYLQAPLQKGLSERQAKVVATNKWEDGPHLIYELEHGGKRVAFFHPGVGAAMAAGLLEEAIAFGCRKFIVVGGAGALEKGLDVGKLILVSAAVRDEGVSYHYLPPAREVTANPIAIQVLESLLQTRHIPYHKAKTWTTDAPYRETQPTINARRAEGCFTVEMESASLMAVAQFRNVVLGQLLYAGDDLSGEVWDERSWMNRTDIRESLFWLAMDACLGL